MKLVKSEPSGKECPSCKSTNTNRQTFHYSVRGQSRGTKGVYKNYTCLGCNSEFR